MDFLGASPILAAVVSVALGLITSFFNGLLSKKTREEEQANRVIVQEFEKQLGLEIDEKTKTDFGSLWAATHKRIDLYHDIATSQSRRSFFSSQVAIFVGFGLLIFFGLVATQAKDPAAAISAASVGVVGGGLSAYIASTFLKIQSESSAQLRQFFLQPVEFARLLGAERLIEGLDDTNKAEAIQDVVRGIMAQQGRAEEKHETKGIKEPKA